MVQVIGCTWYNRLSEFRMVAEPRLTMREITGLESQMTMREIDETTEDRETMVEYNEEREIDN
eukprot:1056013-Amphidinium_carterae.1